MAILIDSNILIYSADPDVENLRSYLAENDLYVSSITKLGIIDLTEV